jgi:hypothetical protein
VHLARADLLSGLILLAVILVIFVPLILLGIYLLKYIMAFGIVVILVCALPITYFIYRLINNILAVQLVKTDGFSIIKDTVSRLSKGEPAGHRHTVDAIYFTKHGRFVPEQTVFDLTSLHDEFYLVVLNDKKKEIKFAYNTMMYDCKELDQAR